MGNLPRFTSPDAQANLSAMLAEAVNALDEDDRQARIAFCREHHRHGIDMTLEGELRVFWWGGRELVRLHVSELNTSAEVS